MYEVHCIYIVKATRGRKEPFNIYTKRMIYHSSFYFLALLFQQRLFNLVGRILCFSALNNKEKGERRRYKQRERNRNKIMGQYEPFFVFT
jgi:hypothetical protein